MRKQWHSVWGTLDDPPAIFTTRDLKRPGKHRTGGTYVLVFRCNSINCTAKLWVRADDALVALRDRGVPGVRA